MKPAAAGLLALVLFVAPAVPAAEDDERRSAATLYDALCAECHGADRLGGTGPALLPENLSRVSREDAQAAIAEGLPAAPMPGFGAVLDDAELQALVEYIYTPLDDVPDWDLGDMAESRLAHLDEDATLADEPQFSADPENIFLVVETADHHVTVLDGDAFEPIHRFESRHALYGEPKYSPDGRFAFLASRDGWISRFDLYNLQVTHEIRAGVNTRNLALSADGRYLLVGNELPHTLVVLDAVDLAPVQRIPVAATDGAASSPVSAVYQAAPRCSFIAALRDVPEIWEVFPDPEAAPASADAVAGAEGDGGFVVHRIRIEDAMDNFFFDPGHHHLVGVVRDQGRSVVVDLEAGREVATVPIDGTPNLASAVTWEYEGRRVMATPHLREATISVVDLESWEVIRAIETRGPGFFLQTHEASPYVWADVFSGPHRDVVHLIDKATLEIVETLRPEPGKTAAHVEFTRDGSHALVSLWETDGALMVFDADTLEEVKRLPMRRPSGKYNVSNRND